MVEEMQNSTCAQFIQLIVRRGNKVPCIILYTKEQLYDIKRFCCGDPTVETTVLGTDKTYNLCDLHVTVTAFKNLSVQHQSTKQNPIYFGPFYLHGNSDFESYFTFYNHLAGQLRIIGAQQQPHFGSDDEKAMKLAVSKSFPQSKHLSCVRHLKNNVIRIFKEKAAITSSRRKQIIQAFFGEDSGLVNAKDDVSFQYRRMKAQKLVPGHMQSYMKKVSDILRANYLSARAINSKHISANWTNNNSESLNHVLKQKVKWKKCSLPELILKLQELVRSQYNKITRTLVGFGSYELAPEFRQFKLTPESWISKTRKQQSLHLQRFLSYPKPICSSVETSTDGTRKAFAPKHGGKKPGQRKRYRNAKTTSIQRKKV